MYSKRQFKNLLEAISLQRESTVLEAMKKRSMPHRILDTYNGDVSDVEEPFAIINAQKYDGNNQENCTEEQRPEKLAMK